MARMAFHPATVPLRTLSPANDTVQAGRYLATTLSAVDTDLATGNIKSGETIFGKAGHTNVRDSSDADLTAPEAPTGKTFYAAGGARKTGSGTKTLNPANETVEAGYYGATTLSAVDGDLAVGNIKQGVTIFGKLGTFLETLSEDTLGQGVGSEETGSSGTRYATSLYLNTDDDADEATVTPTFDAASMAVGTAVSAVQTGAGITIKLQLIMGGVQVAESSEIETRTRMIIAKGTRTLSGAQACIARFHNYAGGSNLRWTNYGSDCMRLVAVIVGSIKKT